MRAPGNRLGPLQHAGPIVLNTRTCRNGNCTTKRRHVPYRYRSAALNGKLKLKESRVAPIPADGRTTSRPTTSPKQSVIPSAWLHVHAA